MDLSLYRTSMFLGPLLYLISSFFWLPDGHYSITGGTLIIAGSVFYVFAFIALFNLLHQKLPAYASLGKLVAIYGCVCGGAAFGLRDVFMNLFSISHADMLQALAAHPAIANLIFWIGGPAFPLSVLGLGIALSVKKVVPVWAGIALALAGILFPVSRILRIEMLAHATDALMLAPLWYIAAHLQSEKGNVYSLAV